MDGCLHLQFSRPSKVCESDTTYSSRLSSIIIPREYNVDGALEKIIPNLENLGITEDGACLRIGQSSPSFLERFGKKSDFKTVAAERNKALEALVRASMTGDCHVAVLRATKG